MGKKTMIWIMAMIAITVLMSNIVSAPKGSGEYIIEGDKVYIDDENVRIVAMPHTIYGSDWVTFNLTSKKYEGGIGIMGRRGLVGPQSY